MIVFCCLISSANQILRTYRRKLLLWCSSFHQVSFIKGSYFSFRKRGNLKEKWNSRGWASEHAMRAFPHFAQVKAECCLNNTIFRLMVPRCSQQIPRNQLEEISWHMHLQPGCILGRVVVKQESVKFMTLPVYQNQKPCLPSMLTVWEMQKISRMLTWFQICNKKKTVYAVTAVQVSRRDCERSADDTLFSRTMSSHGKEYLLGLFHPHPFRSPEALLSPSPRCFFFCLLPPLILWNPLPTSSFFPDTPIPMTSKE